MQGEGKQVTLRNTIFLVMFLDWSPVFAVDSGTVCSFFEKTSKAGDIVPLLKVVIPKSWRLEFESAECT